MFVANANGVLIFDGINWSLVPSKDEEAVYAIFKSSKNLIYYALAESNDFGILEQQEKGKYRYNSLKSNLALNEQPTEAIRQIVELNGAIYFLSADKLIELKNNSFTVFKPVNNYNARVLRIGKHLFVIDAGNQILVLNKGVLIPVKNSEHISTKKIFFCAKLSSNNYALGCRDVGIYIANYDSINPENTTFKKTVAPCDKELIESEIVNGSPLGDSLFVVTSNKKGAFIINKALQIVRQINTKSGIFENNVKTAFEDHNGNLWLPNYLGIAYIEINTPLFKYGRENNISGPVQASCYFQNNLYIGTDKGLQMFDIKSNTFIDVLNFNKQVWFLLNYSNILFICTAKGIHTFDGKKITQITEEGTSYLLNDPWQLNTMYAATENGVDLYRFANKQLSYIKSYNLGDEVRSIATDKNKNVYFSTSFNGIYYLNSRKSYTLDSLKKQEGLPNDKRENFVFNYKNRVLIGTGNGIYSVLWKKNNRLYCVPDTSFYPVTKNSEIFRAVSVSNDLLCSQTVKLDDYDIYEIKYSYLKKENHHITINNGGTNKLNGVKSNLISYDSTKKIVFVSSDEGLFLLNNQINLLTKKYGLYINSIINNKEDTLCMYKNYLTDFTAFKFLVPYSDNNLSFVLGYNCYENSESVEFSYFLEGKDKKNTKWLKKPTVEYSNLFEGKYILHIKAKCDSSLDILEMHIPFEITPPWYRSVFAYIIYVAFFLIFLFIILKLNSKRLIAQNVKLEGIIEQRTETIKEQVHLLEHQKQEITDSINYALRIQQSILPTLKEIYNVYNNCFIFFQPKDIVSGDFYWFKRINEHEFLLACADCTGHGVPGAFMSMICSEKLSEGFSQSSEPDKILYHANNAIKEVLKQNQQEEGKSKDGMEIALIKYNRITKQLIYCGANRPLWLIKKATGELLEIKPTKASIASFTDYNFEYEKHILQLESDDSVYLTSDGFSDQFGGPDGKKFMSKNMKMFLKEIYHLPTMKQEEMISQRINDWIGNLEQVDDLLVIGLTV